MRHSEVRNDWLTGTTLSRLSCVITGRVAYTLSLIRPDDCHSFRSRLFGGKTVDWPITLSVLSRRIVLMI